MAKFEVHTYTEVGGWVNTWYEDDHPQQFDSYVEAAQELDEEVKRQREAVAEGFMDDAMGYDDFKIVEVEDAVQDH